MSYNPNNANGQATMANSAPVVVASDQSSIPINDASGSLTVDNGNLSSIDSKITAVNTGAVVVASSALPTGAATAVKQPALGTAGTPSTDVLTVQGATSMTALKTDGSGVTQPVSGTVAVSSISTSVTPGVAAANLGKAEDAVHASGDTGIMNLAVANEALSSISGTDGDYTPHGVDRKGRLFVRQNANTASDANVSTSTTVATLLASNTARISGSIYNDSSVVMYVRFGANATSTAFKVALAANTYYEIPGGYTGSITGILASSTGTARVAEET